MGLSVKQREYIESLVKKYHRHQNDKSGKPYYLHPIHVANSLPSWVSLSAVIAAYFHDLLEDTIVSFSMLKQDLAKVKIPFSPYMQYLITALSNKTYKKYEDYVLSILDTDNIELICIKHRDMQHNLDTNRLNQVGELTQKRLLAKYSGVFPELTTKYMALCDKLTLNIDKYYEIMEQNCKMCVDVHNTMYNLNIKCPKNEMVCLTQCNWTYKDIFANKANLAVYCIFQEMMYNHNANHLAKLGGN